jgi:hypothetical protein
VTEQTKISDRDRRDQEALAARKPWSGRLEDLKDELDERDQDALARRDPWSGRIEDLKDKVEDEK